MACHDVINIAIIGGPEAMEVVTYQHAKHVCLDVVMMWRVLSGNVSVVFGESCLIPDTCKLSYMMHFPASPISLVPILPKYG